MLIEICTKIEQSVEKQLNDMNEKTVKAAKQKCENEIKLKSEITETSGLQKFAIQLSIKPF